MPKPKSLPYEVGEDAVPYSVTLHSTAGGSDKIYKISVEPVGPLFVVNYANGRRGGTLKADTKTQQPVDFPTARKVANDLLFSKVGTGYVPIAGSRFSDGMNAEAISTLARESSGYLPQLLNPIGDGEHEVDRYIDDDNWVAEEKHDGERRFVIVDADGIRGGNRTGKTVALPDPIAAAARSLSTACVLDGEQVGDVFHAFDVLEIDGKSLRDLPLVNRRKALEDLLDGMEGAPIRLVRQHRGQADKQALIESVHGRGGEGIVFKNTSACYVIGRPGSAGDWVKLKFWCTLSAIVGAVNAKRSVALELLDDRTSTNIPVGNVTIPANAEIPNVGEVVEIRYLYAYDGGSLFQPTLLGKRSDISPEECLASQRVFVAPADNTWQATDVIAPR